MKKYARFYFKGGLIITGVAKYTKVGYNPYMKDHPISLKITPLESVWSGSLHFTTHFPITFGLWDLEQIILVKDYLSCESDTEIFLKVKKNPKHYFEYWKKIAKKIETSF